MATSSPYGTDWSPSELDAIVDDYFAMLREEQAGHRLNKTVHRNRLIEQLDRTKGSIEFKHQNISAVLTKLGLPRITGYLPAWNVQGTITDAIERYLEKHPDPVPFSQPSPAGLAEMPALFAEAPPVPPTIPAATNRALQRIARKFDPALRDQINRALGHAGEHHLFHAERNRLTQADRPDLARKVRWVSQEDGDGLGYDIRSYEHDGSERLLEVKTTRGGNLTPFYLTRNENALAEERPDAFRVYRLYDFSTQPRLFTLAPPLEALLTLEPMTFRASLKQAP